MTCEFVDHDGNDSEVSVRVDPGDGSSVTWCLECFEYVSAQWEMYLDSFPTWSEIYGL
jgi:hypothetical protein